MSLLIGYRVEVSQAMREAKQAVLHGDTLYVSPAMWDLLSHAEGEELRKLLESIPVLRLPEMFSDFFWSTF